MSNKVMAAIALTTAVLVWIGVSAQQEMLSRPGPGSGIMDVRGTVSIAGVTEVRLGHVPSVTLTGPSFLEKGSRYVVTWPVGEPEHVTVVSTGEGSGWVQVRSQRGPRWINLNAARAVERDGE